MNIVCKLKPIAALALALASIFLSSCAGSFGRATDHLNAGFIRMQQFGEDDEEAVNLFTQAIDEYKASILEGKNVGKSHQFYGRILYNGPQSMRNYDEALIHLNEALKILERENDKIYFPMCFEEIGVTQLRLGDYASAFDSYTKVSEIPTEQKWGIQGLAEMYWLGLGVEKDLPEAMRLYIDKSKAGKDLWANIYSISYQINEFKKGNYDSKAMNLYLANFNSKCMGEPKSAWMKTLIESADLGYPPAQIDLWITYRDNKEYAKGMPYLEKALAAQYVPAYFHMGYVYHVGLGKGIDYREAQKLYEKAAVEGFPLAQNNLGNLYFNNQITAEKGFSNQEMAYYWWNAGAEQGQPNAKQNLTLVNSYRPPQSKLETTLQVLNTVLSITQASIDTYNTLNKSKMKSYTPPGKSNSAQKGQAKSSTQKTSSEVTRSEGKRMCPSKDCLRGKCIASPMFSGFRSCDGGYIECNSCRGKGYDKNGKECLSCKGDGKRTCSVCNGTGKCQRCGGTGEI